MTEDPIDIKFIEKHLAEFCHCRLVDSTTSTQAEVSPDTLLIAEHQSAGVGRRGNRWITPRGRSICLSYRFVLPLPAAQMAGYQMTTAIAIVDTIHAFDPEASVQLKWPNDLYHGGKKFAGILINLVAKSKQTEVTVGIGINWQLTSTQLKSIDQPVCNIPLTQLAVNQTSSRSLFIIHLVKKIECLNHQFVQHGLTGFLNQWQKHDHLLNQKVKVSGEGQYETGVYQGINHQGELLLQTTQGIKAFCSGEVSVKAV